MSIALRPYQEEALRRCVDALSRTDRVLLVMATGLGKTVVFSELAVRYSAYGRVLILTHREELVWQALRHLGHAAPGVEMRTYRHATGYYKRRIVVGTVQTVHRRLDMFSPETFSLVIFDEAHHCAAPSWTRIMKRFTGAKVLGVTATPRRSDGKPLPGFGEVAFSYPIGDAICDGWLVPIRCSRMKNVVVDLSSVKVHAGDYSAESLDAVLREEEKLHPIADVAIRYADKKVLVFMPSNESALRLVDVIDRRSPGMAVAIHHKQDRDVRRAAVEMFRQGERKILVNCMIATEGFDVPDVGVIVVGRPTRSLSLYEQMIGRGTRPISGLLDSGDDILTRKAKISGSSKPELLVINVKAVGGVAADTANVINPNLELMDDETVSRVEQKLGEEELESITYARVAEEVRNARIAELRKDIVATCVKYQLGKDGVLSMLGIKVPEDDSDIAENDDEIKSEGKLLGVPLRNMTKSMWVQVKEELRRRRKENLATYKQLKLLRHRGIPDEVLRLLKIGEASIMIDALKQGRFVYFAGMIVPKTVEQLMEMRRRDWFRINSYRLLSTKGA
mgnify:FL=1